MSSLVDKKNELDAAKQQAKPADKTENNAISEENSQSESDQEEEKKQESSQEVSKEATTQEQKEEETKMEAKPVAMSLQRCAKCMSAVLKYATQVKSAKQQEQEYWHENDRMTEILDGLKEREKRKLTRMIKNGEVDYDAKRDKLVYTQTEEEYLFGEEDQGSGSDDY
jgi:hypothetical protein